MSILVNVDNFARAETDRMFNDLASLAGGVNQWFHVRRPTSIDEQTVIRMNRDTLYSFAIVDIRDGATVTIPDAGDRYLSVMVVNEDHYINQLFHEPGDHELTVATNATPYVAVAARTLVDPADRDDIAAVNGLQDQFRVSAGSAVPFEYPDYDTASLDATRKALLKLAAGIDGFDRTFGSPSEVDPVRHLIGSAAGWGGLPEREAYYFNVSPDLPVADYEINIGDVPTDAFWSISMYNADGFFEKNDFAAYSVNNLTAVRNDDGTITVQLGTEPNGAPNFLPIGEGWNYVVRLYQPHPEVIDRSWAFPSPQPI